MLSSLSVLPSFFSFLPSGSFMTVTFSSLSFVHYPSPSSFIGFYLAVFTYIIIHLIGRCSTYLVCFYPFFLLLSVSVSALLESHTTWSPVHTLPILRLLMTRVYVYAGKLKLWRRVVSNQYYFEAEMANAFLTFV
ncbi:hypothetical protein B0H10DRAFT_862074 [Mycena sp. CBHHK59/15]|nr:hypothetical protein B0H10DRAFT_862074 [Mycena sp. CBHHK59/15]